MYGNLLVMALCLIVCSSSGTNAYIFVLLCSLTSVWYGPCDWTPSTPQPTSSTVIVSGTYKSVSRLLRYHLRHTSIVNVKFHRRGNTIACIFVLSQLKCCTYTFKHSNNLSWRNILNKAKEQSIIQLFSFYFSFHISQCRVWSSTLEHNRRKSQKSPYLFDGQPFVAF